MYDVLICGGGTAGVAAAYIAAKKGLKTLLVEKNIHLGGTITSALVIPAMKSDTANINCEFFNDFISKMQDYSAQITYSDGNKGWFNPEIAKIVLDDMLTSVGCEIIFNSIVSSANHTSNKIFSVQVSNETLSLCFESKYYVDATGNGNFSKILNHKFLDDKKTQQPMTLRFHMGGINLKKFSSWLLDLDPDRNVTTSSVIDGEIHLSTAYTWDSSKNWALRPFFQAGIADGVITEADSAYFQVFSVPGMPDTLSFNCPRILSDKVLDPNDPQDLSNALITARKQIFRLSNFVKKYFIGFENAYISNIADMIGIRESNRGLGKYVYTKDDLIQSKSFDNPVLHSTYPIDIHAYKKDSYVLDSNVGEYFLPLDALKSAQYDNLYFAGRNLSASFEAQAALRIQTSCFSMGEAVACDIYNKIHSN